MESVDFDRITATTQSHAFNTCLPYNLNDNPERNRREWASLGRTWYDPGIPISYGINSHGYRTSELATIAWDDAVVCFGDSLMFGTGVAECHTIPSLLGETLGMGYVNLGECNASNLLMAENSVALRGMGIKPRAVVVLLTNIARTTWTTPEGRINLNAWNMQTDDQRKYFMRWVFDEDRVKHQTMHAIETMRVVWRDVPLAFLCWSQDTASAFDLERISWSMDDLARDARHPGPKTNKVFANRFAEMLGC